MRLLDSSDDRRHSVQEVSKHSPTDSEPREPHVEILHESTLSEWHLSPPYGLRRWRSKSLKLSQSCDVRIEDRLLTPLRFPSCALREYLSDKQPELLSSCASGVVWKLRALLPGGVLCRPENHRLINGPPRYHWLQRREGLHRSRESRKRREL